METVFAYAYVSNVLDNTHWSKQRNPAEVAPRAGAYTRELAGDIARTARWPHSRPPGRTPGYSSAHTTSPRLARKNAAASEIYRQRESSG
jgi:hypothetical protein